MKKLFWCLFAATSVSLAAAEEPGLKPSYSASMGSITVGNEQFYRLSLRPDIPIGKWGMAFDVELFIDKEGRISDRGWDFGTSTKTVDTVLRKLYYVRYGKPQDNTFVKVGALDEVTLGYGLIMNGYRNTLQYPGIKKTGLLFHRNNIGSMKLGIEGMVNNFQDFQESSALVGLRLSSKPVGALELALTYVTDLDQYGGLVDGDGDGFPDAVDAFPDNKNLALDNDGDGVDDGKDIDDDNNGAIDADPKSGLPADLVDDLTKLSKDYAAVFPVDQQVDRKQPFNKKQVGADAFSIVGLDAAYPLMEGSRLKLKLYGQFAMLLDDGDALSDSVARSQGVAPGNRKAKGFGLAPGVWATMGPAHGQLEYRYFQKNFDAGYFDNLYELDRARLDVASGTAKSKDASLSLNRGKTLSGVFGKAGADLGGMVDASADYQYLAGGDDPKQQFHASLYLTKRLLESIPRLRQAQAYYQKNNIGTYRDPAGKKDSFFDPTPDTFFGYLLGLEMNSGVSILLDTRFFYQKNAAKNLERQKVMSIETVFTF